MSTGRLPELKAAEEVGLPAPRDVDLAQSCADFYLLERMNHELHPWDGDERKPRGMYSVDFGMGTRRERLAFSARQGLESLERSMAEILATYIIISTGGEARYFFSTMDHVRFYRLRRRKAGDIGPWAQAEPCGGDGIYKPRGIVGQFLSELRDLGGEPLNAARNRPLAWTKWHALVTASDRPGQAMRELGKLFHHPLWLLYTMHGGVASGKWYIRAFLHPDDPYRVVAVLDARVEFNQETISNLNSLEYAVSVGGKNWGQAALLCADYLDGVITPRTFLDRCWSIQHNGGSLFNKLYDVSTLGRVLQIQYEGDYSKLAVFASPLVQALWIEHAWEPGLPWPVKYVGRRRHSVTGEEPPDSSYCKWCWNHYLNTGQGHEDPCGQGGYEYEDNENPGCAYSGEEEGDETDCSFAVHDEYCDCEDCSPEDEDEDTPDTLCPCGCGEHVEDNPHEEAETEGGEADHVRVA